ncbi:repeat-containing protein [Moumouvirus goulette]|uniref:Repeat-containing protein n=1 Tax=Moumouvirus goulette TaxID=1247379 RepID=M1PFQ6_9VIRU|nr:repeat-containing protein [Moumouvirus goulette]AGF84828.1 repeat-containing protein [Moumouvirus goulette]
MPDNVTHLTFGDNFNQKIKGRIPKNVTHLTLKKSFYKRKKNILIQI